MEPISPVVPDFDVLEVVYAKDQPQYLPLPAYKTADGMAVSRWHLDWKERIRVLFSGSLWLSQLTFNQPLQPVRLTATCPVHVDREIRSL